MGVFDGIKQAQASKDSTYLKDGQYIVQIEKCKASESRQEVPNFIIEMTIMHVDQPTSESNPVGTKAVHIISKKQHEYFLPNIKAFLCAATGAGEDDISEEDCEVVVSDEQPLNGVVMEVHARTIITKNAQQPFTKISYIRALDPEEVPAALSEEELTKFYPDGIESEE